MPESFKPTFKDLEKDIDRHLDRFGVEGKPIMGTPVVYGLEKSERAVFDAYVEAGADDAIVAWLMRARDYLYGTNSYFDETIERLSAAGDRGRVSRLWRHAVAAQIENYRILKSNRHLDGMDKSIAEAKALALATMGDWRRCLDTMGDTAGVERLDREIADFEADRQAPIPKKPDPRKMGEALFWEIVGASGPALDEPSQVVDAIANRLAAFKSTQIKVFDAMLAETMQRLNHWDVWAVAYLLKDGCSDDAFEAFRAWVILHGRDAVDLALGDPAALLDRIETRGELDGSALLHVPDIAYDRRAGKVIPRRKRILPMIQGEPWDEDAVAETYPRIADKVAEWRKA